MHQVVVAPFDLEHLGLLQALEPRMRQIERHSHGDGSVRREPLARDVDVEREAKVARIQLRPQLCDSALEDRAFDANRQVCQPELQQLLVG